MITRAKFMNMVRLYRMAAQADVTLYAANFSYAELTQGRKTALVERIEKMYRRKMDEYEINRLGPTRVQKEGHAKGGVAGHDYLNPTYLEKILDPDFNLDIKKSSYKRAYDEGKQYIIWNCQKHGSAVYRVCVSIPKEGMKSTINRYEGYCLVCKTVQQTKYEEKIKAVRQLHDNYMEYRKQFKSQSAS